VGQFDDLLSREVTRKQFLTILGAGLVSLVGFSSLMGIFSHTQPSNMLPGYGERDYGP